MFGGLGDIADHHQLELSLTTIPVYTTVDFRNNVHHHYKIINIPLPLSTVRLYDAKYNLCYSQDAV